MSSELAGKVAIVTGAAAGVAVGDAEPRLTLKV
jgi:hypothetical protein